MEKVTSNIENLELEAERSLDAARNKANEILSEANKRSHELLLAELSFDDIKSECQQMIKNAERRSKEEVKIAQKRAADILTGSEKKVDEVIDRMVKLITGV